MRKYAQYILILIVAATGFLSPGNVTAQAPTTFDECMQQWRDNPGSITEEQATTDCGIRFSRTPGTPARPGDPAPGAPAPDPVNQFENEIKNLDCGVFGSATVIACVVKISYLIFYSLGGFILALSAVFFNALVAIGLSSKMIADSTFVHSAWAVVRDFSNIFFIIVLLYIAFQTILGLGGHHGPKKMIAQVIIMALLINFSIFFTKVVIDSANILGLIFYNKINIETRENGAVRPYDSAVDPTLSGVIEKDLSGGMVQAFNPASSLTWENFFKHARQPKSGIEDIDINDDGFLEFVPPSTMLGITLVSGAVMLFAAYAFFVAGVSFLGRLIELWILIIFSPFAFMSSTLPVLAHVPQAGWDEWLKKLFASSFMAPIFMFLMYFIFKMIEAKPFGNLLTDQDNMLQTLLLVIIPAMVILSMLLLATKFAKKGAGQFGEMVMGAVKTIGALGIGGAALGGAAILRGTLGATAKAVQNTSARDKTLTFKETRDKWNQGGFMNKASAIKSAFTTAPKWVPAAVATGIHGGRNLNQQGQAQPGGVGKWLKSQDEGYGHKTHADHILNAKTQAEFGHQYGKDAKYKDLSEHEQGIVKKEIEKDEMAKYVYGKLFKDLEAQEAATVQRNYNNGMRAIDDGHGTTIGLGNSPTGPVVNSQGNPVALHGGEKFKSDYFTEAAKASAVIGEFVQAMRKGSYDIRNLPDMSAKSKGLPKLGVALVAGVAAGVRLGIKKGIGIEHYGEPKKNIFEDLKNTISDSIKNAKINVSVKGGHGDDHGPKEVKSVGH